MSAALKRPLSRGRCSSAGSTAGGAAAGAGLATPQPPALQALQEPRHPAVSHALNSFSRAAAAAMESSSDEEPVDGHPNSTHDIKPRQARSCSSVVSTAKHAIPSSQTPRCPICSYRFFDSQPEAQRCSHVEACLRAQSEQEARQEATNSAGTTCAVCSVSLAHLSAEQQNAHVNVCLDAAAAAEAVVATTTTANSPKLGGAQRSIRATTSATAAADEARGVDFLLVAECPCCRTTFKAQQTSRARAKHVKACAKKHDIAVGDAIAMARSMESSSRPLSAHSFGAGVNSDGGAEDDDDEFAFKAPAKAPALVRRRASTPRVQTNSSIITKRDSSNSKAQSLLLLQPQTVEEEDAQVALALSSSLCQASPGSPKFVKRQRPRKRPANKTASSEPTEPPLLLRTPLSELTTVIQQRTRNLVALANTKRTEVLPLVLSPSHQPTASPLWSLAFAKPAVPSGVYNLPLLCESAMSECAVAMAAAAGAESTVAALTDIELYSQSQTRAGAPLAASQVHELTLRRDESDSSAAGLPFQAAAWFNRPEYADLELHVAAQHDSVSSTFFLHRMWLQLEGGPEAVPPLLARCTQPQLAMHIIRVTGAAADVWHQALTFVYTGQCIVSGRQLPELLAIAAALNHRALGAAAERVAGDALSESRAVALVVDSCSCSAPVAVAAAQPAAVPASPVGSDADLPEAFAPPSSKRSPPAADVAQMVVRGAAQPLETAATAETRQYAADEAPPAKKDRHNHVQEPAPASEHDDDDEDQQWLAAATQRHSSSDAGHASGSAIPATIMKQSAGGSAAAAILVDDSGASDTGPSQSALEPAASLSISATFDQMAAAEEEDEEANKAEAEEDSELPSVWGRNMLAAPDMQPPASPSLRGSPTDTAADDEAVTDTTVVAAVSGEEPDSPPVVFQVYGDPLAGGRPSSAKVPVRPAALSGQRDALPLQLSGAEPAAAASLAASQSDAWRPVLPHAPDAAQVAAMVSALRSDEQLYGLILELQPVPLSAIQAVLTRTGLTCSRHTLVAFCDEQGISWSTADSDKRPRIKSKKSTKNHVGD